VKVDPVSDAGFIAVLKVADTLLLNETPTAEAAGRVETTVGAALPAPVVKDQIKIFGMAVPAISFTSRVIVTVTTVLVGIAFVGASEMV